MEELNISLNKEDYIRSDKVGIPLNKGDYIHPDTVNISPDKGDYIHPDTGLLYCGKCHTPKQCRVTFAGVERRPMCLCSCEVEKIRAEKELERKRITAQKIEEYRKEAFSEQWMRRWNFATDDGSNAKMTKIARNYVDNFDELLKEGRGLLLSGNTGIGKTFAACEIVNGLIDRGFRCYVTNFARLLNALQGTYDRQELIDGLSRYQLIVIDDLGVERTTEFAVEQVYNIVDSRYRSGLPMIITTNLSLQEIKRPTSYAYKRIYERILERCLPIDVDGQNERMQRIRDNYETTKKMLGI